MSEASRCISQLLHDPWSGGECAAVLLSKLVGYGVIAGSALVKLPQILKIRAAGSVDGISSSAVTFDFLSTLLNVSYFVPLGYPFSTWGENAFLLAQNSAIYLMHAHYSRRLGRTFALEAALCCGVGLLLYRRALPDLELPARACAALGLKRCTLTCEELTGTLPMVLGMVGRLPQIAQNVRQGHTGELAFITYFMNVMGAMARLFTTLQELDDPITLASCVLSLVLNLIVVIQILLLGGPPRKAATKAAKDHKKTKKTQ